jgi:hypothetical protein
MNDLFLAGTSKTPEITFKTNGEFTIKGSSYPEDSNEFYSPATQWLSRFFENNNAPVNLSVDLKYVNTSSIKSILNLIMHIRTYVESNVKVAWMYELEDEDMLATGEDLQEMCKIPFEFIEKKQGN